jgi:transposase-like protein
VVSVVATSYLLSVSTRRVDKLLEQLGIRRHLQVRTVISDAHAGLLEIVGATLPGASWPSGRAT